MFGTLLVLGALALDVHTKPLHPETTRVVVGPDGVPTARVGAAAPEPGAHAGPHHASRNATAVDPGHHEVALDEQRNQLAGALGERALVEGGAAADLRDALAGKQAGQCTAKSWKVCCTIGKPCDCKLGPTAPGQCGQAGGAATQLAAQANAQAGAVVAAVTQANYPFCCGIGTPCDCAQVPPTKTKSGGFEDRPTLKCKDGSLPGKEICAPNEFSVEAVVECQQKGAALATAEGDKQAACGDKCHYLPGGQADDKPATVELCLALEDCADGKDGLVWDEAFEKLVAAEKHMDAAEIATLKEPNAKCKDMVGRITKATKLGGEDAAADKKEGSAFAVAIGAVLALS